MNAVNHAPDWEAMPIAVRGYAPAPAAPKRKRPSRQTIAPQPSDWVVVFDTETTIDAAQQLRFGTFQVRHGDELKEAGLFYDPESLTATEQDRLRQYADNHGYVVYTVSAFIEAILYGVGYDLRATFVGFNLPFDIARLAIGHNSARGAAMHGGFSFQLHPDPRKPRIQVKHLSSRCALIRFTAPPRQRASKGQRRRQHYVRVRRGFFVDVKTLAAALTSQSHSLDSLGRLLKIDHGKHATDEHGGPLSEAYLAYAMGDVQATWECFEALRHRYLRHGLTETPVHRIYSEASLGKAYLKAMGICPWRSQQPDFPPEMLGIIMSTYYGGRSEVHWRREAVPVLYCDFLSMYPTVCTLMGLWCTVTAEGIEWTDATDWVRDCLQSIEAAHVQDADFWTALPVLVQVVPEADIFPVRAKYGQDASFTIGLNQLTSESPLWYTLADCIASKLLTGKSPRIVQAVRFTPKALQKGLRPVSIAGKPHYRVDPVTDDFYCRLIDLRRTVKDRVKDAPPDEREALEAEQLALKILANATSYGSFVEFNVEEQDDCVTATCYGPHEAGFPVKVHQIEKPGTFFHPLLATLITGAARLMLAITERLALDAGIDWAFCDTDSMALAQPPAMAYKDFLSRALSVQRWFDPLNPYEQKGPLLKIEDANYRIASGRLMETLEPLYCWAVSSKRYALFNLDVNGKPVLRKASAHGLGHLLPPYREHTTAINIAAPLIPLSEIGVERWQYDLWYHIVEAGLRGIPDQVSLVGLPGLTAPAASRYAATTPALLRWFKTYNEGKPYRTQVRPFNFLLAFQGRRLFAEPTPDEIPALSHKPKPSRAKLPHLPRAVAPYSRDIESAATQCFDRSTGQSVLRAQLKTYGQALAQYHLHPEAKVLQGGYTDRGRTRRRHVYVTVVSLIGKEANRWEEQFYLGVEVEAQGEYGLTPEERKDFIAKLKIVADAVGGRSLAEAVGVCPRHLANMLHGRVKTPVQTVAKIRGKLIH
jgi:hypothetical protein